MVKDKYEYIKEQKETKIFARQYYDKSISLNLTQYKSKAFIHHELAVFFLCDYVFRITLET